MKIARSGLALATVLGFASAALGQDLSPSFTPVHLVHQSKQVLQLEFKSLDSNTGLAVAKVVKVLKAEPNAPAPEEIKIDFLAGGPPLPPPFANFGKEVMRFITGGDKQAILFVAHFKVGFSNDVVVEEANEVRGFLNIHGTWAVLEQGDSRRWDMQTIDEHVLPMTWWGGTDMLIRCADYIVSDPNAEVPVTSGVEWAEELHLGKIDGRVFGSAPVDVEGKGKPLLFVACEKGDRLFRIDGNVPRDVTEKVGLSSRSRVFAWGDFDDDGRLDLASWDGNGLTLHLQRPDAPFRVVRCKPIPALAGGCRGLAALDGGKKGLTALLATTNGWPVLLYPRPTGDVEAVTLGEGNFPRKEVGDPGPCLVEDFDGEGIPDVVQVCATGGLFYKGKAPGELAAPVRIDHNAYTWILHSHDEDPVDGNTLIACAADFDGDGRLDVMVTSSAPYPGFALFQNHGCGKFTEETGFSGDISYLHWGGAVAVQAGDINNDGWQDLLFAGHNSDRDCPFLFNRGFRFLAPARDLHIGVDKLELTRPPRDEFDHGEFHPQAGCLADFNGDGALDLALVLHTGEVCVLLRKADGNDSRAVVASLGSSAPTAGPVTLRAYNGKRLLGGWSVRRGGPDALIGTRFPATITLKWTWPSGEQREKQVQIKDGPTRVVLEAK